MFDESVCECFCCYRNVWREGEEWIINGNWKGEKKLGCCEYRFDLGGVLSILEKYDGRLNEDGWKKYGEKLNVKEDLDFVCLYVCIRLMDLMKMEGNNWEGSVCVGRICCGEVERDYDLFLECYVELLMFLNVFSEYFFVRVWLLDVFFCLEIFVIYICMMEDC